MNTINKTWTFNCQQFPNDTVKKFKVCFCVHGDQQLEGIDLETYTPVIQWNTVSLMTILENLLGLKSKQANVTAAFFHATLGEDEKVYVKMPVGFKQHGSYGKFNYLSQEKSLWFASKSLCLLEISLRNLGTVVCLKLLLIPALMT